MQAWKNLSNKSSKVYALLSLWICLIIPLKTGLACFYVPEPYTFNFINRDIIGQDNAADLILKKLHETYFIQDRIKEAEVNNIKEWQLAVCSNAEEEEIKTALNRFSVADYEKLLTNIKVKSMPVPYQMAGNYFINYLHKNKCEDTVNYLIFSKKCEPYAQEINRWSNDKKDLEAMQNLITEGLKAFKKCKSDYMRLRYAYQLVRLAHYSKNYKQAIELYDYLMPKLDVKTFDGKKSLIYYWVISLKAGALRHTRQYAEASFLFAKVYENCTELQDASLRSFLIKNEEEWKACMAFCTTNDERASLYAMRANEKGSKALNAMKSIYKLAPNNKYLKILLIKELEELEEDLLGITFNKKRKQLKGLNIPRNGIKSYAQDLRTFAMQVIAENKVLDKDIWKAAQAYVLLLTGENREAGIALRKLASSTKDEILKDQVETFLLAQIIDAFNTTDEETENLAYSIMRNNKHYKENGYFPRYLGDKLSNLYLKEGSIGKSYLCHDTYSDLKRAQPEDIIKDLVKLVEKPELNNLEKLLLSQETEFIMKDELYDLLAVFYMQEGNFEAALESYRKIPRTNWDNFGIHDPFRATITDCHSCPHSKDTIDLFNRGEFMEEILNLQFKIKAEEKDNASYYLKIGVGLYNSSYYGHSWQVMDYYRSVRDWVGQRGNAKNKEVKNLGLAAYYFDMARQVANDPEQAAKACYMAAKCELIDFYHSDAYIEPKCCNQVPYIPENYGKYYDLLLDLYGDTKFYEKIITECQFFRAYAYR
jgi:hypothetical protein